MHLTTLKTYQRLKNLVLVVISCAIIRSSMLVETSIVQYDSCFVVMFSEICFLGYLLHLIEDADVFPSGIIYIDASPKANV